jgi:hypothetical protein
MSFCPRQLGQPRHPQQCEHQLVEDEDLPQALRGAQVSRYIEHHGIMVAPLKDDLQAAETV